MALVSLTVAMASINERNRVHLDRVLSAPQDLPRDGLQTAPDHVPEADEVAGSSTEGGSPSDPRPGAVASTFHQAAATQHHTSGLHLLR